MKVLSQRTISPARSGPSIRCWIKDVLTPVASNMAFVFERAVEPELLSDALAKALVEYPMFAGTLRRAGPEVFLDCSGSGASFEVVRHEQPLRQWMPTAFGPKQQVPVAKVTPGIRPGRPMLHVRVNQFPGEQTVIGVSAHHTPGDGPTLGSFFKAWSDFAAGLPVESPVVAVDRVKYPLEHSPDSAIASELRLVSRLELARNVSYFVRNLPGLRVVSFHFSDRELANLRHDLQERAGAKLSTNDALMAHLMTIIQHAAPRASGRDLLMCVNGRSRAGIEASAAGNYISVVPIHCRDDEEPDQVALRARSALAAWSPNYHSLSRFVAEAGGNTTSHRMVPAGLTRFQDSVFFSKMANFGFYDIAFGGPQPSYIMLFGSPLPWFAYTLESYRRQGLQLHLHAPRAAAKRLRDPAMLARVHRYRDAGAHDASAEASWLL